MMITAPKRRCECAVRSLLYEVYLMYSLVAHMTHEAVLRLSWKPTDWLWREPQMQKQCLCQGWHLVGGKLLCSRPVIVHRKKEVPLLVRTIPQHLLEHLSKVSIPTHEHNMHQSKPATADVYT